MFDAPHLRHPPKGFFDIVFCSVVDNGTKTKNQFSVDEQDKGLGDDSFCILYPTHAKMGKGSNVQKAQAARERNAKNVGKAGEKGMDNEPDRSGTRGRSGEKGGKK